MMNNLLSFTGYQDGGVVWDDDIPTWADITGEMGVDIPIDYEQFKYEYDPSGEEYLKGKYGRAEDKSALDISGAYRGMTSGLRDIVSQGRETLAKMRTPSTGGFAGGGDLLSMSIEDLYSGAAAKRGTALGGHKDFLAAEALGLRGTEADIKEDIRGLREDWEVGAIEDIGDWEEDYGEDFDYDERKRKCAQKGSDIAEWRDGKYGWDCYYTRSNIDRRANLTTGRNYDRERWLDV